MNLTVVPQVVIQTQVPPICKHSTPLECDSLNAPFSILTAKQYHPSGVKKVLKNLVETFKTC